MARPKRQIVDHNTGGEVDSLRTEPIVSVESDDKELAEVLKSRLRHWAALCSTWIAAGNTYSNRMLHVRQQIEDTGEIPDKGKLAYLLGQVLFALFRNVPGRVQQYAGLGELRSVVEKLKAGLPSGEEPEGHDE